MRHWSHRVTEVHPSLFLLFSALFRYHIPSHRKKAAITVSISTRVYIQILSPIWRKIFEVSERWVLSDVWVRLMLIWDQLYLEQRKSGILAGSAAKPIAGLMEGDASLQCFACCFAQLFIYLFIFFFFKNMFWSSTLYKCRKRPNLADKINNRITTLRMCTSDIHLSPLQTDERITVCFYISRRKGPIAGSRRRVFRTRNHLVILNVADIYFNFCRDYLHFITDTMSRVSGVYFQARR